MSMDMDSKLFVAAFHYEDGRVLYVLKEPQECASCHRFVKLVVEIDGAPPRDCVACVEIRPRVQSGLQGLEVRKCAACGSNHSLRSGELWHDDAGDYFLCPRVRARVDIIHTS